MELENEATFDVGEDCIEFTTKSNGDKMRIHNVHMTPENAAALSYLTNKGVILEVQIKEKGT